MRSKGRAGDKSVGVNRAEDTDAGEKSGEFGDSSELKGYGAGRLLKGEGDLRLSVRKSCSTC